MNVEQMTELLRRLFMWGALVLLALAFLLWGIRSVPPVARRSRL